METQTITPHLITSPYARHPFHPNFQVDIRKIFQLFAKQIEIYEKRQKRNSNKPYKLSQGNQILQDTSITKKIIFFSQIMEEIESYFELNERKKIHLIENMIVIKQRILFVYENLQKKDFCQIRYYAYLKIKRILNKYKYKPYEI